MQSVAHNMKVIVEKTLEVSNSAVLNPVKYIHEFIGSTYFMSQGVKKVTISKEQHIIECRWVPMQYLSRQCSTREIGVFNKLVPITNFMNGPHYQFCRRVEI